MRERWGRGGWGSGQMVEARNRVRGDVLITTPPSHLFVFLDTEVHLACVLVR